MKITDTIHRIYRIVFKMPYREFLLVNKRRLRKMMLTVWQNLEVDVPILINKQGFIELPAKTDSLVKEFAATSMARWKKKAPPLLHYGDTIVANLDYWDNGNRKTETYGSVRHSSRDYIQINWGPKYGDYVDNRDIGYWEEKQDDGKYKLGYHTYYKCYGQVKKERNSHTAYMGVYPSGSRDVKIETEYSAVGPDGEKIWFRKIELPDVVKKWTDKLKIEIFR